MYRSSSIMFSTENSLISTVFSRDSRKEWEKRAAKNSDRAASTTLWQWINDSPTLRVTSLISSSLSSLRIDSFSDGRGLSGCGSGMFSFSKLNTTELFKIFWYVCGSSRSPRPSGKNTNPFSSMLVGNFVGKYGLRFVRNFCLQICVSSLRWYVWANWISSVRLLQLLTLSSRVLRLSR